MIANIEKEEDVIEFIDKVIVSFHSKLMRGAISTYNAPDNCVRTCFGGLQIITGDHIGQVALMGKKGPSSDKPARFDNITQEDIPNYHTWTQRKQDEVAFKPAELRKVVDKARTLLDNNQKGKAEDLLNEYGFSKMLVRLLKQTARTRYNGSCAQSPLWKCEIFRDDFFLRFGICFLHLILLGWWKTTLRYMAKRRTRAAMEGARLNM